MKRTIGVIVVAIVFVALMVLPGFVLYIVGDIANKLIPDKKKEGAGNAKD